MAMEALQASGSLDSDQSAGLLGWNSDSVGSPCPEAFYPYQSIPQSHPQSPSLNNKRPHHESSSIARMGLSPKRKRIGDTGPCGSGAQEASHSIIVPESTLPSSSDATSFTVDVWGQAHASRVNNTHMRETPENTLNGRIRAGGPLAIAHPMESSPVRQPRKCTGMPGPPTTALGQGPTLSNGPEQPPLNQHGTASLLTAELDSGALFLEQDEIVPCPVADLWQSDPRAIDPALCPGVSSESLIQLHTGNGSDAFFHRLHDRTEESTPCFTASGSSHFFRSHLPQVFPDHPITRCPPKEHTSVDSVSEQVFQLPVTGRFTVC